MVAQLAWFADASGLGAWAIVRDPISSLLIATAWVNRRASDGRWGYAVDRTCDGEIRHGWRNDEVSAREGAELVVAAWLTGPSWPRAGRWPAS